MAILLIIAAPFLLVVALVATSRAYFRFRELGEPVVGPLFPFELVRLARRGVQPRLRALLAALLLGGLMLVYLRTFPGAGLDGLFTWDSATLERNRVARFGEAFAAMFLGVQLLAVTLLAPAYAAGAVTEERDRRTLEFLQASPLSGREIVLGKFLARLAFVLAVVLAGLPVLMFTTFFGGVDPEKLLAGFAVAAVSAVHLGSYALLQAVRHGTLLGALFRTYLMLALTTAVGFFCGGCANFTAAVAAPSTLFHVLSSGYSIFTGRVWDVVVPFAVLHLLLGVWYLRGAIREVRASPRTAGTGEAGEGEGRIPPPGPNGVRADLPPTGGGGFNPLRVGEGGSRSEPGEVFNTTSHRPPDAPPGITPAHDFVPAEAPPPPLTDRDDPLVWRELHFAGRLGRSDGVQTLTMIATTIALYPIVLYLFVGLVKDLDERRWIDRTVNFVVRAVLELVLLTAPLVVGLRAAGSVGAERQAQTLTTLLTIPWSRREILGAKLRAAVRRLRTHLGVATGTLALGTLLLGVHPYGAFGGGVLFAGFLGFCAALGIYLSVAMRTAMRATLAFVGGWCLALLGPAVAGPSVDVLVGRYLLPGEEGVELPTLPVALWDSLFEWRAAGGRSSATVALIAGLVYAGLGWLLWRAAANRFEKEGME